MQLYNASAAKGLWHHLPICVSSEKHVVFGLCLCWMSLPLSLSVWRTVSELGCAREFTEMSGSQAGQPARERGAETPAVRAPARPPRMFALTARPRYSLFPPRTTCKRSSINNSNWELLIPLGNILWTGRPVTAQRVWGSLLHVASGWIRKQNPNLSMYSVFLGCGAPHGMELVWSYTQWTLSFMILKNILLVIFTYLLLQKDFHNTGISTWISEGFSNMSSIWREVKWSWLFAFLSL